jgi:O-antigen/teichoic acid export membrane protein
MATVSMRSKTIRSFFWRLFEQGGSSVIQLVVQVVMARLLSPEEFGMLAIMVVFINIGNVVVQSGLNTAIVQSPDSTERDYSTVFWMSLAISLLLYVLIYAATPLVADYYAAPAIVGPLRVLTLVLVINAYNAIQEAIVARNLEFQKTFRSTVTAALVSGAGGILAALWGAGIWALVCQQLLFQLCKSLVLAIQIPWKPQLVFDRDRAVVLFGFGWKLLASGLLDQGYQSVSDLVIGRVFSKTDLGYVNQGKRYPQALGLMLDGSIQPVVLSAASRVQDDTARVKSLARRGLKTSTFFVVPAMVAFAVVARPLVGMLLGDKWLPSVPYLQLYCLIYLLLPINTTNLQVLNGMGRSDLFLRLEVCKKLVGLSALCFTALVLRDLNAIVVSYVFVGIAGTFINAYPNKRVIGYAYLEQLRDIAPAFVLSAASAALSLLLLRTTLAGFALVCAQVLCMAVCYLGLAWLFRVEELTYLLGMVQAFRLKRTQGEV